MWKSVLPFFKEIRVGTPLLYSVEDAEKVTDILGQRLNASVQQSAKKKGKEHFVLVGAWHLYARYCYIQSDGLYAESSRIR